MFLFSGLFVKSFEIPYISRIVIYSSVCGKITCRRDVDKRHLVPASRISVDIHCLFVRHAVGFKISKAHIWVGNSVSREQIGADVGKGLSRKADVEAVDYPLQTGIVGIIFGRTVASEP